MRVGRPHENIDLNTGWAPLVFVLVFEILLWFLLLMVLNKARPGKDEFNVFTGKNLIIAVANLIVSAPVAYIFTVEDPFTGRKHIKDVQERKIYKMAYLSYFLINLCFMIWGVLM